jgi:hypothetical protein
MLGKHMDEARRDAVKALEAVLASDGTIHRIALIDDLFGRLRAVIWVPEARAEEVRTKVDQALQREAGLFWTRDVWMAEGANATERMVYDRAWEESQPVVHGESRLRVGERHRNRSAWFRAISAPPWPIGGDAAAPPIVTFYSFKGGVGRTTALAAFAIQRARAGERVAVVDMDLDAPGAGALLAADERGTMAPWGVVDFLLERAVGQLDLRDYYHACRREAVTRQGEILVVPAGVLGPEDYLNKLARVDLEPPRPEDPRHPLQLLLEQINTELQPQWLLLDARAGLSEPAGLLLGGIAHLSVLFGTSSEQSWQGLRVILERIGASRVREDNKQLDCVLVHAMVPEDAKVGALARAAFETRALEEFRSHYYAADPVEPDEDRLWYVRDSEASDAPHVPAAVSYQPRLAHYERIDDVADTLAGSAEYQALAERIQQRFLPTRE